MNSENNQSMGIRLLEFLVRLMVPSRVREEFVGDLLEEWSSCVVPRLGKPRAFSWLCSQLLRSLLPMARVWVRGFFFGDNEMFQRQNVPTSVKMVAVICLLFSTLNFALSVFVIATAHTFAPFSATIGLLKVVLFIAVTVGLLNLSEDYRKLMLLISGLTLLVYPIVFSIFAISPEVFLEFAEISIVKSRVATQITLAIVFVVLLWIFITLRRSDVKGAFKPGGQETLAT